MAMIQARGDRREIASARDLKAEFTIPNGFSMQKWARSVTIKRGIGLGKGTILRPAPITGIWQHILCGVQRTCGRRQKPFSTCAIREQSGERGCPASYAMATCRRNNGPVDVTVFALLNFLKASAFICDDCPGKKHRRFSSPMYQSIDQALCDSSGPAIRARKVDVVTIKSEIRFQVFPFAYGLYDYQARTGFPGAGNRLRARRAKGGQKSENSHLLIFPGTQKTAAFQAAVLFS